MARQSFTPRKQRTRQHVIADLSVNHVERVALLEGCAFVRFDADYGYDLVLLTFDRDGYVENGVIFFQLKASESLQRVGENFAYDIDIRDYNSWVADDFPVFLVLYDAGTGRAYWVHIQGFFRDSGRRPQAGARTVRVHVPATQVFNRRGLRRVRRVRQSAPVRIMGESSDD